MTKKRITNILIIVMILFATFRDGLGTDYYNYLDKRSWEGNSFSDLSVSINSEPLFSVISIIANKLSFPPALFFVIFSSITLSGIVGYYNNVENKFLFSSIIIFSLFPTLYFNTFNLVRQFLAASLFFIGIKYINSKQIIPYLILIAIAAGFHFSALILFPLYFVLGHKYKIKYVLIALSLVAVLCYNISFIFEHLMNLGDSYTVYLDSEEEMGGSMMIMLINIIFIIYLLNYKKIISAYDVNAFNCLALFTLFSDLSYVSYFFFRVAVFFTPILAYTLPKALSFYLNKKTTTTITILISLYLFLRFILENINNPVVVPQI